MKRSILFFGLVLFFVSGVSFGDIFGTGENQFSIEFLEISGDASSANGSNITWLSPEDDGYRTFNDPGDFRIGKFEITNEQWNKFKNLYGTVYGFPRYAYEDESYFGGLSVPVNKVSWVEAAQFVNYLNTYTGNLPAYKFTGTKGTADYTYSLWEAGDDGYDPENPYRNSKAKYFLPTESEWVKAAYWNGGGLQDYAAKNDGNIFQGDGSSGSGWNFLYNFDYATDPAGPWEVGSGSEELNGTFDMMGNVSEWVENPWDSTVNLPDSYRAIRGGGYNQRDDFCILTYRNDVSNPKIEKSNTGFRVASILESCDYVIEGDLDDNCKVDLVDFMIFAGNWLTDCAKNPSDPGCVPKEY